MSCDRPGLACLQAQRAEPGHAGDSRPSQRRDQPAQRTTRVTAARPRRRPRRRGPLSRTMSAAYSALQTLVSCSASQPTAVTTSGSYVMSIVQAPSPGDVTPSASTSTEPCSPGATDSEPTLAVPVAPNASD